MDDQTEDLLIEVLAQMYEAEDEAREIYGGVHPKHVAARRHIEGLLFPEDEPDAMTEADRAAQALR